ncbi:amino acid racemase [Arhodomonas aquaeolei]|uniref:aspartate/glutamate racemase family protein n=1 Tax=Arhodomonas aquaeolei TaxID=2369 RepID=UPI002168956E|nr:amino acid racemase [Arhodomonas aquaeolei]MCS4504464.1 amino acid racemase [Arhodomonas aquaeolei]
MSEPVVGVIGGMGPEATVELMQRVIDATPAADDADHIHMLVDNNPKVPSRIKALIEGAGEDPGPTIAGMARSLEGGGADFLVIPCNTAHHYWGAAAAAVSVPVWNLVDLTLATVTAKTGTPARVGMLASPALRKVALYEQYAQRHGVSLVYPGDEGGLLEVIRAVKADRVTSREVALLAAAARELAEGGADALVLGCTEFSLIADRFAAPVPAFDTLQVLAERIVAYVKHGVSPGDRGVPAGVPVTTGW